MNLQFAKIARNLNVATSTVHNIYKYFETTGSVDPIREDVKAFYEHTKMCIVGLVLSRPSMYRIAGNFGEVFNLAIWRILKKIAKLKLVNI